MCNIIICKDRDRNKDFPMTGLGIYCSYIGIKVEGRYSIHVLRQIV